MAQKGVKFALTEHFRGGITPSPHRWQDGNIMPYPYFHIGVTFVAPKHNSNKKKKSIQQTSAYYASRR